jgi:signal transduction histidine kinase
MRPHPLSKTPARWLYAVLIGVLMTTVIAVTLALDAPWLGLRLEARDGGLRVESARGPSAQVPRGAQLLSVGVPGQEPIVLRPDDIMEEPDVVDDYVQMDAFFDRQGRIAAVLAQPLVVLEILPPSRAPQAVPATSSLITIEPGDRPLSSLPLLFWFQVAISIAACMIATWVWVLRPRDWGARIFGLTGLLFPLFALPAAIYGTRELALPSEQFFALSAMNHGVAFMWGAALVAIFMSYPQPLVRPRHLAWPFVVFGLCWVADVTRTAPDLDWGNRYVVTAEMLLVIAMAIVQWIRSRGAPLDRAALRWFSVSLLLGSSLFILTFITTVTLGWLPPLPQGYAFGFFMLIYIGIALGLRRYRLFNLDEWAWQMLVWVGGALAVVTVDALLIVALDWSAGAALGTSLWVCGLLYFPARQWLWQKLVRRPALQLHELMPDLVRIAFQPSLAVRETLWERLLRQLYAPLELKVTDVPAAVQIAPTHAATPGPESAIAEDGLSLDVPPCAGLSARRLRYPDGGQRLFSPKDAAFVAAVCELMNQADAGRNAHERGATEERRRIARDMHDDIGARLLMLIHRAPTLDLAELARSAMNDLRTALAALEAQPVPLADALADWRAEATSRCEAAGVALEWRGLQQEPAGRLDARHKSLIERALRESLTNALKHAAPTCVQIEVDLLLDSIALRVRNNGQLTDPVQWVEGRGLIGMRQRLAELGGTLEYRQLADGQTEFALQLPPGEGAWG